MKLLFIENRYKTYLFEAIAEDLSNEGYEIFWIVQNKKFEPKDTSFKKHIIKYPAKNYRCQKNKDIENIIESDRQLNHFNKKDNSYFYYYNDKINAILKELKPDLVFGESTAFHELLTIHNCKKLKIPYLNPSSCRYPIGRFSFYKYDTLEPYKGSGKNLNNKDAQEVIDQIIYRKAVPDYMKVVPITKKATVTDQLKKVLAYVNGERFNTPNPLIKYKLEKQKSNYILNWDNFAARAVKTTTRFKILYPLQMQPEANIDVWGKKYRDQTALIKEISKSLPKDCVLYVKPNPKSKYELTAELIEVVKKNNTIIALQHTTKMDDVLPKMDLVITVTGTVAIECILVNKPVVTLVKTLNNSAKNCIYVDKINKELSKVIVNVKIKTFPKLDTQEKINFINLLNSTSYKGIVSDPFSDSNCISKENINKITDAFQYILTEHTG